MDIFVKLWYIWALIFLGFLYKFFKPSIKGWFGEQTIAKGLASLPENEYIVLNDLIYAVPGGTMQIDYIVASLYGVFVIETKNCAGWITGDERSAQWTQNLYGKKSRFMNPIRQNAGHAEAVKALLGNHPNVQVVPIVAFSPNCDLRVRTVNQVVYLGGVARLIRRYKEKMIGPEELKEIAGILRSFDINTATKRRTRLS